MTIEHLADDVPAAGAEWVYSPTQISMYMTCPLSYWWRYRENVKSPPGVAQTVGSSFHKAVAGNNRHKLVHGADLPAKDVTTAFADTFADSAKEIEDWAGERPDAVVKKGCAITGAYMTEYAPKVQRIRAVELDVRAQVAGRPFRGIVDLDAAVAEDDQQRLYDYKVTSRGYSGPLAHHLQLGIYAAACNRADIGLIEVDRKKAGACMIKPGTINIVGARFVDATCRNVIAAIEAGIFPPCDPASWKCSAKWCGYYSRCRGSSRFKPPFSA